MKITTNCPKHGETQALVVQGHRVLFHEEWPKDPEKLEALPRVCLKCLAESMVQPIRRSAREVTFDRSYQEHLALRRANRENAERRWKAEIKARGPLEEVGP